MESGVWNVCIYDDAVHDQKTLSNSGKTMEHEILAPQDVGAAISRPPKIIAWPDFSGVFAGVALRAADSRPYGMRSVQLSVNRLVFGSVA